MPLTDAELADVFKKDVYALARHVNSVVERREAIPESSMTKPPSAELAPNQFDQDTLPPYPLLDAILEMPIAHVLDHLPLPEATDAALRGENNKSRRLLDAVIAYEQGGWDRCMNLSADAGMERLVVPFAYGKALQWYRQFKTMSDGSAPAAGRTGA